MGKTQSKPFVAGERQGNGMGTAWERHGMCESAFRGTRNKLNNGGKRTLLGYLFTITTYKFEITATILFTNILLI
jgi:hypothetical protein